MIVQLAVVGLAALVVFLKFYGRTIWSFLRHRRR